MTESKITTRIPESKSAKVEDTEQKEQAKKIADLNDKLRVDGKDGKVLATRGVKAMGNDFMAMAVEKMRHFTEFTKDNDPYGEHDFGMFFISEKKMFFKIDYYDLEMKYHSPDPANPEVTIRVLTLMLAEEY